MMTFWKNAAFLFLLTLCFKASGQLSIYGGHTERLIYSEASFAEDKYQSVGMAYWFRFKKYRIEFHPGIFIALNNSSDPLKNWGATLSTQLYPFDFYNDCQCPTFNKSGEWWKKGFFWQLEPSWFTHTAFQRWSAAFRAGLDIGLNKNLTISPAIGYRMDIDHAEKSHDADIQLRLLYRWDEK